MNLRGGIAPERASLIAVTKISDNTLFPIIMDSPAGHFAMIFLAFPLVTHYSSNKFLRVILAKAEKGHEG
jgi:hypothetical protein